MPLILGTDGYTVQEDFTVYNGSNLVTGLVDANFSKFLYSPDGTQSVVAVVVSELGSGNYRAEFVPNQLGTWYLTVTHPSYFPWGKSGSIQVFNTNFNLLGDDMKKVLGLNHENVYIDQAHYDSDGNMDSARLRIYSDAASVGTSNNVIATYRITANTIGPCKFSSWKQVEE